MHTAVRAVSIISHGYTHSIFPPKQWVFRATVMSLSKLIIYVPPSVSSFERGRPLCPRHGPCLGESWANFDRLGTAEQGWPISLAVI